MQQLRNTTTGESFARKILRSSAFLRTEDLENEIRAVDKLREAAAGQEENIVIVTSHGTLSDPLYYFFDMELCDFNLQHYITVLGVANRINCRLEFEIEGNLDYYESNRPRYCVHSPSKGSSPRFETSE